MKNEYLVDLNGEWRYLPDPDNTGKAKGYSQTNFDDSAWKKMKIPSNWYQSELGDYFGAVWFRTQFDLPENWDGREVFLKFASVDYYADVWLNDTYLGHHEGYFTPFEFRVTDILKKGVNTLVVKDDSPRDSTEYILVPGETEKDMPLSTEYRRHWAKDLTLIKGHHIDAMHRPGSMTKFRGDGNSGGIWQKVELQAYCDVRVLKTKIYSKIVWEDNTAIVSVDMVVENLTDTMKTVDFNLRINPYNFEGNFVLEHTRQMQLQPGYTEVKLLKTIENPELWNTWDFGKPNMYQACVSAEGMDTVKTSFGIKEFVHDEDSGHFSLNGNRIFLRGMRYFSSHWISEMNESRYREDLEKMIDLNINSIRIGSHVEMDDFYSLCDELGLLVWQVFPLHYCYSDSDALIEKCVPMMKQMVEMLYNHASIGCWSVFKEPKIYALPDAPNNYGRLCQMMIEAGKTVDPIRWIHSGDYEEHVQNIMVGMCRPWDWDMKKAVIEPIIVEFGCGAFVSKESMLKVLPEKDLWPPNWDKWEYYNGFYDITFNTADLKMRDTLEDFIEDSQDYQARSIKEQIEFCRQSKYKPVGSMFLYYWNDPFANIGASGLMDYFRVPFKSYDAFKQVYTPVLVSFEWSKSPYILGKQKVYDKGTLFSGNIWVTNDHLSEIDNALLSWNISGADGVVLSGESDFGMDPNIANIVNNVVWNIPENIASGEYKLEMLVTGANGKTLSCNDFAFEIK